MHQDASLRCVKSIAVENLVLRLAQLLPEEAERALMLCETFIAGYYEKAEEIGDQLSLEALEVGPEEGYEFSVIAAVEQDLLATFKTLFERIRRELDRRQIEPAGGGTSATATVEAKRWP